MGVKQLIYKNKIDGILSWTEDICLTFWNTILMKELKCKD